MPIYFRFSRRNSDFCGRLPRGQYHSPLNPRIVASGPWLNSFEIDPRAGITVESPDDARKAVASLADGGVDFIKVYLHLPREVFLAILEEAQVRDLPVAGHVPLEIDSMEASELGMRSIEHMRSEIGGFCAELAPDECANLLTVFRENNTWQTPTLLVKRNRDLFGGRGARLSGLIGWDPGVGQKEQGGEQQGSSEESRHDPPPGSFYHQAVESLILLLQLVLQTVHLIRCSL